MELLKVRKMKPYVCGSRMCFECLLRESRAGVESRLGRVPVPVGFTWLRLQMASEVNCVKKAVFNMADFHHMAKEGGHVVSIALVFPEK